jgi:hypothetical protein
MALVTLGNICQNSVPIQFDTVGYADTQANHNPGQKNVTLGCDYWPVVPAPAGYERESNLDGTVLRRGVTFRASYPEWLALRNNGCLATA